MTLLQLNVIQTKENILSLDVDVKVQLLNFHFNKTDEDINFILYHYSHSVL